MWRGHAVVIMHYSTSNAAIYIYCGLQGGMLDELDEDVEGTSARLAAAQKRINHVLAKAGMKGQMCIILFLIVVLAVLIIVAFS